MISTAQLDRENQLKKGRGIAGRFVPVLQSIQAFSTVVETFVSSHPNIAALPFHVSNEVMSEIQLAKALVGHQEQKLRAMERAAAFKQRLMLQKLIPMVEKELDIQNRPNCLAFAHTTVRDFMVRANLPVQLAGFRVDLEEADHFVGEMCITYLHFDDFKTTTAQRPQPLRVNPMAVADTVLDQRSTTIIPVTLLMNLDRREDKTIEDRDLTRALASYSRADTGRSLQQSHPFLGYARRNWLLHTTKFSEKKSINWKLRNLPTQSEHRRDELLILSASQNDTKANVIFLDVGECSMRGINKALQAALGGGHLQVVERLLTAGADVNAAAEWDIRTALQAASEAGHLRLVERLLAAATDNGETALWAASRGGHLQVAEEPRVGSSEVGL
ncbi:hypothetical protein S7711_09300 [Stachybotrys chartarum IBT 7711]|uniref:Uncharacterized protein n=1 Tax=Stachybotrys chartarum (strain CBS 109288 / IBT 7711) TaxID=1280523 RepID=A0A084BCF4_STACB|nr:hypothetical protein S7711_09300 [Stachybotrys chartarum IBT 7711]